MQDIQVKIFGYTPFGGGFEDVTKYVSIPIKMHLTRDESLDTCSFHIPMIPLGASPLINFSKRIDSFTEVEIIIDGNVHRHIVIEDDFSQVIKTDKETYFSHKISTIEHTKILELRTIKDMTITQPQGDFIFSSSSSDLDQAYKTTEFPGDTGLDNDYTSDFDFSNNNPVNYYLIGSNSTKVPLINSESSNTDNVNIDGFTLKVPNKEYNIEFLLDTYNISFLWNNPINDPIPDNPRMRSALSGVLYVEVTSDKNGIIYEEEKYILKADSKVGGSFFNKKTYFKAKQNRIITSFIYTPTIENETISLNLKFIVDENPISSPTLNYYNTSWFGMKSCFMKIYNKEYKAKTITFLDEAVDKLLEIHEIRDVREIEGSASFNNPYEFTLGEKTRTRINNIVSPEFTFDKFTLFDALFTISSHINAIPRLSGNEWNILEFDFIDDYIENYDSNLKFYDKTQKLTSDSFATNLEINADNVIEDLNTNSIKIEPFRDGWLTIRSQKNIGAKLIEEDAIIQLTSNIYKIERVIVTGVKVSLNNGFILNDTDELDITDYVVPFEEFNTFREEAMTNANRRIGIKCKANTLYYKQFENKIFNLGVPGQNYSDLQVTPRPAVYEAIASKLCSEKQGDLSSIVTSDKLQNVKVRVYMTPAEELRCQIQRNNFSNFKNKAVRFSNETEKVVDSFALGNVTKKLGNRSGNVINEMAYMYENFTDIPVIGSVDGDNNRINVINVDVYNNLNICSLLSTKNTIGINRYVGVKSAYRQFQTPKQNLVSRNDFFNTNIVLSTESLGGVDLGGSKTNFTPLSKECLRQVLAILTKENSEDLLISYVDIEIYENSLSDEPLTHIELPTQVTAIGNSLLIKTKFQDNYSAGSNLTGAGSSLMFQEYTKYTNDFGQFNYLIARWRTRHGNIGVVLDDIQNNSNEFPRVTSLPNSPIIIENRLKVSKDAREKYTLTNAVNVSGHTIKKTVTGDETVKVYSGLLRYNPMNVGKVIYVDENNPRPVEIDKLDKNKYLDIRCYSVEKGYIPDDITEYVDMSKIVECNRVSGDLGGEVGNEIKRNFTVFPNQVIEMEYGGILFGVYQGDKIVPLLYRTANHSKELFQFTVSIYLNIMRNN